MNSYTVGHEITDLGSVIKLAPKATPSLTPEQFERAEALKVAYEVMPIAYRAADLIITAIYILTGDILDEVPPETEMDNDKTAQ
jgi:hypothetical protein